jgi:hypothetical protein
MPTTTATDGSSTKPTRMDEIMEQAKVRRAKLEDAQNKQAREPPRGCSRCHQRTCDRPTFDESNRQIVEVSSK